MKYLYVVKRQTEAYCLKSLFEQKLAFGSTKPEVVRSAPPKQTRGATFIEKRQKQSKDIIDWLSLMPSWLFVSCNLEEFTGLDFCLLP